MEKEAEWKQGASLGAHFYRVRNQSLAVCHCAECRHCLILPTQRCAILGSVIPPTATTSVRPRCLTNECVRKCFLLPSSDGEFIRGTLPPPLCRHALPCGRFLPSPEAQGTCLMWSCARDLKPCCCLLGRLLFLATDLR